MKAIVYHRYGSPAELKFQEVDKPVPRDNEVLVKVHAASVNAWDWDMLRGEPFLTRVLAGIFKPKYKILGADISGKVEAVGKRIKQFRPGDEVFGDLSADHWGGFAEYVCAKEKALLLKPSNLTHEEAAAVPQAALLAWQGLYYRGKIRQGQKVLINGAGGGVGTFAVQIAKMYGAEVTGVDSTSKLDMLRSIGADHVIDYTKEDYTRQGWQYDLILDTVAYRPIADYKRALCPGGTFVMIGGSTQRVLQVMLFGAFLSKGRENKKIGILIYNNNPKDLATIKELLESKKIKPIIGKQYALHEVPQAFEYFSKGEVKGKAVVVIRH